ncbi:TARBP1 [Branchiostoma lanceolatum]|uniref:tRNA (guanosine(18)-2'-O)-methyltransferase TARBP1 n=1 Tax=Branchiostoma lanceolatum TaxID=7740 RepID=A0A8K0ETE0_BRALA|nr:TARBP1 [Branchiostoma lanceolatum]CAH1262095.1 TARBP1 [Branchiostoma lanceolatum]
MDSILLKLLQRESAVSPVQLIQNLLKEPSCSLDDRIEALNSLCSVLESDAPGCQHDQVLTVCEEVINTICIPSLKAVNTSRVGKTKDSSQPQRLHAACELLIRCLGLSGPHSTELIDSVALLIDASLRTYCEEQRLGYDSDHKDVLDVKTAVEVMNYLLKHESNLSTHHKFETQLFPRVLDTLEHSRFYTEGTSSRVVGILLPKFLSNVDRYQERISAIWYLLLRLKTGGHDAVEKAFLLLCGLADHFFGGTCSFDVTSQGEFWALLQVGLLTGTNAVTRKRAMYLLKRAIDTISRCDRTVTCADANAGLLFWWSPAHAAQLMPVWQDYILIIETLEENQVHVVKPVLPRMKTLITAMATVLPDPGCLLLHPSWLYTVYRKAFTHDNKNIHRWALLDILQLDLAASPHIITMGFTQFILGPVMSKLLQDTSLYNRLEGEKLGSCPVIGQAILPFLTKCLDMLGSAEKVQFMQDMITAVCCEPCGAVPLLYVTQALASIPPVPTWGDATLAQIRQVVMTHVMTNNITLRGAIQCHFAQAICNMADVEKVSLQQLAGTLACLEREDGCMVRGTGLWGQVSRWLTEHGDHLQDLSSTQTGDPAPEAHLRRFLQAGVQAAIQVSPEEASGSDLPGRSEAHSIAMLLLLAVDGQHSVRQLQGTEEQQETALHSPVGVLSLEPLLSPVAQVMNSARTHPYLPPAKADRCLHILSCLMEEHGTSEMARGCCASTTQQLSLVLQSCLEETLAFLVQKLTAEITKMADIGRVNMYTQLLKQFSTFYPGGNHATNLVLGSLQTLVERSIKILESQDSQVVCLSHQVSVVQSQLSFLAAMRSLSCVCEIVQTGPAAYRGLGEVLVGAGRVLRLQDGFGKPADADSEHVSREDWGRAVCLYVESQWTVVDFLLWLPDNQVCHALGSPAELLTRAMDNTEVATGMAAIQLMRTMERLIPLVHEEGESMCVAAMDCAWKLVQDFYRDTDHFWPVMYSFVVITFHPALMAAPATSTVLLRQHQYADELFAMGERIRGVTNILLRHCCGYWAGGCSSDLQTDAASALAVRISSATAHMDMILEAATFGPHFKRNLRTELDTIAYVKQLGNKCSVNEAYKSDERDDKQVRACIVNFLVSISRHQEQWTPFIELLFTRLVEKDQEMTQKVHRYHLNAYPHRYKNRVWQVVLIIMPYISETLAGQYVDHLFNTLAAENQISVRYMVEWCLLLLLHKYPSLQQHLWDGLRHDSDKRIGIMASQMEITAHLGLLLEDKDDQEAFFDKAFPAVMPWALVPHFAVRVFALSALQWMWRYCQEQGFTGLMEKHSLLRPCLDAKENITANKVWKKLTENWYIYNFRPRQDYSVETIFHSLPYLSGITDAEWISPNLFLQSPPAIWHDERSKSLPLWNPRDDLRKCVYSLWKIKGPGIWNRLDNKQEESQAEPPAEGNVQKKIITWRHTLEEPHLNMADMHIKVVRKGHLVVVASLIDKPTNLGGLCRTCEIFGVSTLVLGSMKYVEDKTFQQLSVSSQGWVNIQEVRPGELPEYVEEMRRQGYFLIGVEQTADSRNLTEFTFPDKSLLLLGNEKEGIPVELIHQLDVCVEIPQQGICRSLNVHVSGALLIWEYTRQQVIKD